MTAQRWFLTTPEQYERAPVGTTLDTNDGRREWTWIRLATQWVASDDYGCSLWPPLVGDEPHEKNRREVKRWGTDADHQRACEELEPKCACFVTPVIDWFYYGSAVEPGSQFEWNPDCPVHRA